MRAFVHGIAFSEISAGVQGPGEGVYASHMAAIGVLPAFFTIREPLQTAADHPILRRIH